MLVMAIGGMIALINPANNIIKIFSYSLAFYGIWLGLEHCLTLNHIHEVVHSENPFAGVDGCREIPIHLIYLCINGLLVGFCQQENAGWIPL